VRRESPPTNQQALEDQQVAQGGDRPLHTGHANTRRRGAPAARGRRADKLRALRQARAAPALEEQADDEASETEDDEEEEVEDIPPAVQGPRRSYEDISGDAKKLSEPLQKARLVVMVSKH
jgi:hypothetical protein